MTTVTPGGASLATARGLSVAGSGVTITSAAVARAQHCLHSRQLDVRNTRSTSAPERSTAIASDPAVTPSTAGAGPLATGRDVAGAGAGAGGR